MEGFVEKSISEFSGGFYVGQLTLNTIEKFAKNLLEKENKRLIVSFKDEDKVLRDVFLINVARLEEYYGTIFIGLYGKEDDVLCIRNSGLVIKDNMEDNMYIEKFKKAVEIANFPLMIRDDTRKKSEAVDLKVIQPIFFDENFFYYNSLKSSFIEPVKLQEEIQNNNSKDKENIWDLNKVHLSEIASFDEGYRFASNLKERTILDIYNDILCKNKVIEF